MDWYVGRRLSYQGNRCTVRYFGTIEGKNGPWLGVEWDDETTGKHDGSLNGHRYFQCKNLSCSYQFSFFQNCLHVFLSSGVAYFPTFSLLENEFRILEEIYLRTHNQKVFLRPSRRLLLLGQVGKQIHLCHFCRPSWINTPAPAMKIRPYKSAGRLSKR